jgi:hypothetical protein
VGGRSQSRVVVGILSLTPVCQPEIATPSDCDALENRHDKAESTTKEMSKVERSTRTDRRESEGVR